jgi:hypothetical protein
VVFGGFEFAPNDLGTGTEPPETKLYTTLLSIANKRTFPYITSPLTRVYHVQYFLLISLVSQLVHFDIFLLRLNETAYQFLYCSAGFTAWSSTRDPSQVFQLLEAIYNAFDEIAKSRKVFKVETVGDCYVAVTGLPDPQPNHALIMARFASECLIKMGEVTQRLETSLGPDTAELRMRIGLHSGPVTAGVLRGDKSRFQLFG